MMGVLMSRATSPAVSRTGQLQCSKRLRPMVPVLLPALERHGRVVLDEVTRFKLLAVSTASIDRLLADVCAVAGGGRRRPAGFGSAMRRSVPIRTLNDWGDPVPGWVEVDFVAHSGTTVSGAFVQTMVLTDVATGWTECIPLVVREAEMVVHALGRGDDFYFSRMATAASCTKPRKLARSLS